MQLIADSQMMRRTVALRTTLYALMAAPLLMAAWVAAVPAHAEEAPFISVVTGLAPDDLLNVRAKPSPIGKTEARLAAGASVRNLGCNDIDGHPWCKVETDNPKASGWAPARYLVPVNPATVPLDQAADAGAAPDAATPPAAAQPDLTARLGGAVHPVTPEAPVKSAAEIAMQDAYGLALAANETPSTGEIPALAQDAAADSGSAAGALPVPTPRPQPADAAPVDTQTVAELPPQPTSLAQGGGVEIPCARYVGQPMQRCAAAIVHKGADKAEITVTWPDGGTRLISFYAGLPAGSDAKGDFRFTREGSLSMIRIGVSERFEITDTVAFGR